MVDPVIDLIPPSLKGLGYAAPFAGAAMYLMMFILKRYDSDIQSRVNMAVSIDALTAAVERQNQILEQISRKMENR